MYYQFDEVVEQIRTKLCLPSNATEEAARFVADLVSEFSVNQSRTAYELFADVVEVRHGTRGIALAIDGIRDVITACCAVLDIENDTELQLLNALNSFRRHLQESPRYSNEFSATPRKKNNVITYFLVHTRNELIKDATERWEAVCLIGYAGTRMGLNSSVSTQNRMPDSEGSFVYGSVDHQAKDSARAVEIFIKHVPLTEFYCQVPSIVQPGLIEHTIRRIAKKSEGLKREYTVERYIKWCCVLLNSSPLNRRRRVGTINQQNLIPGDTRFFKIVKALAAEGIVRDSIQESCDTDLGAVIDDPHWIVMESMEIEEGASPYEFTPPPTPSDVLSLRAGLRERAYLCRPLGWTPVWQGGVLTQEALGTTLAYFINNTPIERMDAFN